MQHGGLSGVLVMHQRHTFQAENTDRQTAVQHGVCLTEIGHFG